MKNFKLSLMVPAEMVGTFFELIKDSQAQFLALEPYSTPHHHGKRKRFSYKANGPVAAETVAAGTGRPRGPRPAGTRGIDLLLESIKNGPKTDEQLRNIFVGKGRKPNSVSPLLSKLLEKGTIRRNEVDHKWVLE